MPTRVHACFAGCLWLTIPSCAHDPEQKETGSSSSVSPAEATAWCEDTCLELRSFVEEEGFGADMAAYDSGCASLAPDTCEDCYEQLTAFLVTYAVVNECYCLVPDSERDLDLMPTEICEWILEEGYGGSESAMQADCTCGS